MTATSYAFSVLTVSLLASKALHIRTHFAQVAASSLALHLPALFVADLLVIAVGRLLLWKSKTLRQRLACVPGVLLSVVLLFAASSQLGFYLETGGEVNWRDAGVFVGSKQGLIVALSGMGNILTAATALLFVSALAAAPLNRVSRFIAGTISDDILAAHRRLIALIPIHRFRYSLLNTSESSNLASTIPNERSDLFSDEESRYDVSEKTAVTSRTSSRSVWSTILKITSIGYMVSTIFIQLPEPYPHLSKTLPLAMTDMIQPRTDLCKAQLSLIENVFPFPHMIAKPRWRQPLGRYLKGWAPLPDRALSPLAETYRNRTVSWMPHARPPRSFFRWDPLRFEKGYHGALAKPKKEGGPVCDATAEEMDPYYNPVGDPLKITNLDRDLLPSLKQALGDGNVKIKHVVLVMLEGIRQELYPLQQGSHYHDMILSQSKGERAQAEVNRLLSQLTPNIEAITGSPMGFGGKFPTPGPTWNDSAKTGSGGVNVIGGYTAATTSTKSYAAAHCGTPPMSADGLVEAWTDSYQPCLTHIFDMLNLVKTDQASNHKDYRDSKWRTAFMTATTEEYDAQKWFNRHLGFKSWVTSYQIEADKARFNKNLTTYQKVNYFSYPEPVLLPHLNDFIDRSLAEDERMFLSHFTSTSHHTWGLPSDFPLVEYIPSGRDQDRNNFNKFLNTVRYTDQWLGTLMQLLEDKGIANETLVVFTGDHGLTFKQEGASSSTYLNGHLGNFRVGMTFRHPHLPRAQYEANATTLSILPTILDLLVSSGSLNEQDAEIASDLLHDYEGQSLVRPYKQKDGDRRAWAFTVINPGGKNVGVTSADVPWRLVMPLEGVSEYRLTNARLDPMDQNPVTAWTSDGLLAAARKRMGEAAAEWAAEAIPITHWWVKEKQRLWRYRKLS